LQRKEDNAGNISSCFLYLTNGTSRTLHANYR
jgi:hypothetical protein